MQPLCNSFLQKVNKIIMSRIYNETWESAKLSHRDFSRQSEQKYFGKITIDTDVNTSDNYTYHTIFMKEEPFFDKKLSLHLTEVITSLLVNLLIKHTSTPPKVLCVGLGNEKITPDSLGSKTVDLLTVTSNLYNLPRIRSKYGNLCAYKSSVSGLTGIESYDLITSLIDSVKPDIVIAIDTLCTSKISRLAKCIQITDDGIIPGGGVNNAKQKLNKKSLGIPVIAIGVPLVIYLKTVLREHDVKEIDEDIVDLAVTAKDIDFLIDTYSSVIAEGINQAIHGKK